MNEQRMQEAARAARLSRIGMGDDAARPAAAQSQPQSARMRAPSQRPAQPAAQSQPQSVRMRAPSQRPAQPAAQSRTQHGAQPVRTAPQQNRVAARSSVQPVRTAPASAQQPVRRTPAAQTAQRHARPAAAANAARTAPSAQAQSASRYAPQNNTVPAGRRRAADADGFRRNFTEDESRAMMFSLTGKADQPSYGGDVDVIDIGRVSSGRTTRGLMRAQAKNKSSAG